MCGDFVEQYTLVLTLLIIVALTDCIKYIKKIERPPFSKGSFYFL